MVSTHSTAPIDPDGVDLSDLDGFWTEPIAYRHAAFDALRERPGLPHYAEPAFWAAEPGPGYYAVTRRDDIVTASGDPAVFRSGSGVTSAADLPVDLLEFLGSMINMDDPRHGRLRRIVARAFTPKMLDRLTGNVTALAGRIVDDVIERGSCDAAIDIAARLPLTIICDLMGVPASQRRLVFDRTNTMLGAGDPDYTSAGEDPVAATLAACGDLAALMRDLATHRRNHQTDDLTSALVAARVDGEALAPDELASFFILLLAAGNETTRNAISWGISLLTEYPDERAAWLDDLDRVTPTAVEEIVRWASPVIFMRRTVARATELGGQRLVEGDKVLLFYWAANRDPRHFVDPARFDVRRSPNPHLGFGGPGPHLCLGAHLARREIAAMFRELLTRVPDIHATEEPDRLNSSFTNGIKHLPVVFTPH